jgi:hypothetical protein
MTTKSPLHKILKPGVLHVEDKINNHEIMGIIKSQEKSRQYMTTKPALQNILKGILPMEDENKPTRESMGIIKSQEKSRQVIRV